MATSGAMSTDNQYIKYTISITQNSQSIIGNTSNVTVKVRFYRTNTGYTTYGTGTVYCTINGTTYSESVTSSQKITSSGIVLFTKTVNISHNSDGTKTLTCSAKIDHQEVDSSYQSYSQTLTTIPRKSTLSVGNGTLGTAQTLTVTRQSSSFTHTITYSCGSASGTVASKSTSTSISFTPPLSLASQNTTGTSVSVKYTITTYNGSTSIGSNSYTKTCSIPSSVKPSCSISLSDSTGHSSTYGRYIQGISKFKVTVTGTQSYSSAISLYSTTANGSTYTSSSFTTGVLKTSGTLSIVAKVTDKRGRSGTSTKSVSVLTYNKPQIKKLSVNRCDSDGTENSQGEYTKVTFSYVVTSLNSKNSVDCNIKYKKSSETSYTTVSQTDLASTYTATNKTYIFAADSGSSYDVILSVGDNFSTSTKNTSVSTGFTIMNWKANGLGMALGKVAELDDCLDIGFESFFRNNVIVENNMNIVGKKPDGTLNDSFTPQNYNGNTVVGYGNYDNQSGNTNIYGHNINLGVSDLATPGYYKPYYNRGDVITLTYRTTGYITNSKKDLSFWIPLAKPVIGSPTVTVTSLNGFVLRQGDTYTHGSGANTYVTPVSYEAAATYGAGIYVKATFSDVTNATNNDTIGIYWNGKITLS